jgi:hypothetical protein
MISAIKKWVGRFFLISIDEAIEIALNLLLSPRGSRHWVGNDFGRTLQCLENVWNDHYVANAFMLWTDARPSQPHLAPLRLFYFDNGKWHVVPHSGSLNKNYYGQWLLRDHWQNEYRYDFFVSRTQLYRWLKVAKRWNYLYQWNKGSTP